jgi:hypothetical protein
VFSVRSMPGCYKQDKLVGELVSELEDCRDSIIMNYCSQKLAAEAGESSGTQTKGNVCH